MKRKMEAVQKCGQSLNMQKGVWWIEFELKYTGSKERTMNRQETISVPIFDARFWEHLKKQVGGKHWSYCELVDINVI